MEQKLNKNCSIYIDISLTLIPVLGLIFLNPVIFIIGLIGMLVFDAIR